MNSAHSFQLSNQPRGVALVIVLAMLVLLSALLVAFMSTATTERASSYANAGVTTARQIADSTVSLVISQIRDATSAPDEGTAWASQPGAIRTFSGGLSGQRRPLRDGAYYDEYKAGPKDFTYKLYSADKLKMPTKDYETDAAFGLPADVQVIEDWQHFDPTKDYVDLNQPHLSPRRDLTPADKVVEPHYPIIDPRAAYDQNENPVTGAGKGIVHGFDAKLTLDDNLLLPSKARVPYLPMPVKWLYVLEDGTIGPASRATEKNQIVGRTAFWTDDDSCKINVNTASEGTFWDTPTVSIEQESGKIPGNPGNPAMGAMSLTSLNLASSQPIRGEYQRYGGHPATTCLSPVLGWLWPNMDASTPVWPSNPNTAYRTFKEAIYAMSPFLARGNPTTQGASRNSDGWLDPVQGTGGYYNRNDGSIKLDVATKHLYATVDELLFKPARFTPGGQLPEINDRLTPEALEKVRFFLSPNSRAPELNLFGRPRVTLWPVHATFELRTAFDDLFLFTSTISKGANLNDESDDVRYNFLRSDAKSDQVDFNPQNRAMFTYLQGLTSQAVPGFGGSLANSWESDEERDEILTLIFDYVRAVNLVDTGTVTRGTNKFGPYTPRFFKEGILEDYTRRARSYDWSGQVTPLKTKEPGSKYQGLGRFATVSEVALIFVATTTDPVAGQTVKPAMQAILAMEMTTPMPGYPALRETYWTRVRAIDAIARPELPGDVQFKFATDPGYQPMGFKGGAKHGGLINICNVGSHEVTDGRAYIPTLGFTAAMHWYPDHPGPTATDPTNPDLQRNANFNCLPKTFTNSAAASQNYVRGQTVQIYPYVSNKFDTTGQTRFSFRGGRFEIEIYAGEAPAGISGGDNRSGLVQTIHVHFPDVDVTNLPVPVIASSPEFRNRFPASSDKGANWDCIRAGDVVRSMELTCGGSMTPGDRNSPGDIRLAMARTEVPPKYFAPRQSGNILYTNGAIPRIHGLTKGHGDPLTQGHSSLLTGQYGRLAPAQVLRTSKPPILPTVVNGVKRSDNGPGDWDRGISKHMSGAFGNKVDEGNMRFNYSDGSPAGKLPYYRGRAIDETGQTFFSPNKQMPSAVMLGSLPTGVVREQPWQTLLFRPNREATGTHPGAGGSGRPPDHLVLDLFSIPVVEPYAISEPFSTAGKVNLNYVIAPFSYAKGSSDTRPYIRRDSAVRGLLKSTFVMAIPPNARDGGHTEDPHTIPNTSVNFRFPIDLDKTIAAMDTRLTARDTQLFRSASEICTVDLYPAAQGGPGAPPTIDWATFWNTNYTLTGDNMRERPYAFIYPRTTTKSNVYTVHMRCQAIRKSARSEVNEFDPELDQVVGDYRGSATIERFIDPNDLALAKYNHATEKVDPYYRYRIVNTKHFSPR